MFPHTLPLYKIALELENLKYLNDLFTPLSLDDYQYNFKNIYINSYSILFNNQIGFGQKKKKIKLEDVIRHLLQIGH